MKNFRLLCFSLVLYSLWVSDDDIYFYLNGVLVNRAIRVKPTVGRIQIQSEGAEMFVGKFS